MYWIKIYTNGNHGETVLDYIYHEEPVLKEDLDEYFGNRFDMQMGPREYWMEQQPVKHPPKEWLSVELKWAELDLQAARRKMEIYKKRD